MWHALSLCISVSSISSSLSILSKPASKRTYEASHEHECPCARALFNYYNSKSPKRWMKKWWCTQCVIFKASTRVVQYMQSKQVTFISVKSFVSPFHQQSSSRQSHIMRFFYLHPTRFACRNGAEKSPTKAIFGYDAPEPIAFASVHHCILQCVRNDDRL